MPRSAHRLVWAAVAGAMLASGAVQAQLSPDWTRCINQDGRSAPDIVVCRLQQRDLLGAADAKNLAIAHGKRGNAHHDKGEYDRAIADYTRAIEINPTDAVIYNNRGIALSRQGRQRQARSPTTARSSRSIRTTPLPTTTAASPIAPRATSTARSPTTARPSTSIRSWQAPTTTAASPYRAKGDNDGAIADHTKAIDIDPELASAYYNRALAYRAKGDNDHAIEDTTTTIEINPRHVGAYFNRGLAHAAKGNHDRAIADYSKAIEINPKHDSAYHTAASPTEPRGTRSRRSPTTPDRRGRPRRVIPQAPPMCRFQPLRSRSRLARSVPMCRPLVEPRPRAASACRFQPLLENPMQEPPSDAQRCAELAFHVGAEDRPQRAAAHRRGERHGCARLADLLGYARLRDPNRHLPAEVGAPHVVFAPVRLDTDALRRFSSCAGWLSTAPPPSLGWAGPPRMAAFAWPPATPHSSTTWCTSTASPRRRSSSSARRSMIRPPQPSARRRPGPRRRTPSRAGSRLCSISRRDRRHRQRVDNTASSGSCSPAGAKPLATTSGIWTKRKHLARTGTCRFDPEPKFVDPRGEMPNFDHAPHMCGLAGMT